MTSLYTHHKQPTTTRTWPLTLNNELSNAEPRHLSRCNATFVLLLFNQYYPSHLSTVARKIPFDDPVVLNYVRIGYVLSQVIMLGVYYYVSTAVIIFYSFLLHPIFIHFTLDQTEERSDSSQIWQVTIPLHCPLSIANPHKTVEPPTPMVRNPPTRQPHKNLAVSL